MSRREAIIRCRGHSAIRATHHKTLEWIEEHELSERGTCVVGVAAEYDRDALARLRGKVEMHISAGGASDALTAFMSPTHVPGDRLVVRLSPLRQPQTLATAASKGAADLDRGFVRELQKPDAEVRVVLRETEPATGETAPPAVVFVSPLVADPANLPEFTRVLLPFAEADISGADFAERARLGHRVVMTMPDGPVGSDAGAREQVRLLWDAGVEVVPLAGWSAVEAAVGVSGAATPYVVQAPLPQGRRDIQDALAASVTSGNSVVLSVPARQLVPVAKALAECCATAVLTVLRGRPGPFCGVWRGPAPALADAAEASGSEDWTIVIPGAAVGSPAGPALDSQSAALLRALLAERVKAPALSKALARALGISRQEAYTHILRLNPQAEADSPDAAAGST